MVIDVFEARRRGWCCGDLMSVCVCTLDPDHDGPHTCELPDCLAQWTRTPDGNITVVRAPKALQ
jgi:hypothetical protein